MRRLLHAIYRLLLYAYPPDLRRTHGSEMRQWASAALSDRGLRAVPGLFLDLCGSVPREWALRMKGLSMRPTIGSGLMRDLSYAGRLLWRSPGFTVAAVLTLALGIGANAAIFSLAEATLMRPVKVAKPAELYAMPFTSAYPDYLAYAERGDLFAGAAASSGSRLNAVANHRAELVDGRFVSGSYFTVLGIAPAAGRLISPSDDERNGPAVGVLGYSWWKTRFGGDPAAVGTTIHVNNVPVTIIGVAPKGFNGTSLTETTRIFLPINQTPRVLTGFFSRPEMLTMRNMSWVEVILRLKPGIAPRAAAAGVESVYRQFHPVQPGTRPSPIRLSPIRTRALGDDEAVTRFVTLLGGVVALTLLIGCANLANLLLSRAAQRRREIGVRMAIGAGRARIARQLLVESLVLAAAGGLAGTYVALITLRILSRFQLPGGIEIQGLELGLSGRALAFTALVTGATGLLFGLAPAWRAGQTDVLESLRSESRATSARSRLRSALVSTQIALSLVLLTGTGLFLRSLEQSLRVPLGFRVDHVATASVNLGAARYDKPRALAFYQDALDRVRRLSGVTAAAWSSVVPTTGARSFTASVEGYEPAPQEEIRFYNAAVGPDYFKAAGTRILRGRAFTAEDAAPGAAVSVIVNETAVRTYFGGRDPLQGRIRINDKGWLPIVGVAEDTVVEALGEEPVPYLYLPVTKDPLGAPLTAMHLMVRTNGSDEALLGPLAAELRGIDPDAPIYDVSTFTWRVRELVMPQRMGVTLFAGFSLLALTLAAIGIYGVASYVAALRTRELGIRIALGADRRRIRALVLRQGSRPIAAGVGAGLVIAALGSRLAEAFLRGVAPHDPLTYAAVTLLLGAVALCATWIPASRAARLDPIQALRQE